MKIRIVTNAIEKHGMPRYIEHTDRLKARYCASAGWEYVCRRDDVHPELPPHWSKPSVLMEALRDCDWVVWMDCDAAPVNRYVDIAGYLATVGDRIVMQRDIYNWNAGVFAVPRSRMDWLEYIEEQRNCPQYHRHWMEQLAMIDSFKGRWGACVVQPPREIGWNSYLPLYHRKGDPNLWREGDWVLHLPALDNGLRERIFYGISTD